MGFYVLIHIRSNLRFNIRRTKIISPIFVFNNPPKIPTVSNTYGLVEVVTHRICQSSYGIIQDEEILVLILPKGKDQRVQDETQVWY